MSSAPLGLRLIGISPGRAGPFWKGRCEIRQPSVARFEAKKPYLRDGPDNVQRTPTYSRGHPRCRFDGRIIRHDKEKAVEPPLLPQKKAQRGRRPAICIPTSSCWLRSRTTSRVEEAKQFLLVSLAQGSAHAHVAENRSGDTRRKAFRGRMAARAILIEEPLPFLRWRRRHRCRSCRLGGRFDSRCLSRRHDCEKNKECWNKEQFNFHSHFPFQAGKRNR